MILHGYLPHTRIYAECSTIPTPLHKYVIQPWVDLGLYVTRETLMEYLNFWADDYGEPDFAGEIIDAVTNTTSGSFAGRMRRQAKALELGWEDEVSDWYEGWRVERKQMFSKGMIEVKVKEGSEEDVTKIATRMAASLMDSGWKCDIEVISFFGSILSQLGVDTSAMHVGVTNSTMSRDATVKEICLQHPNNKIQAIKAIRSRFGIGLKGAKELADKFMGKPRAY